MTPPLATAGLTAGTAELPSGTMGAGRKGWLEQAALVALFEAFGWAYDVRLPRQERLDARRATS